ncbi:MAG: Ribosomal protein L11 [Candidatus Methanohalarchaeum thermophilum]|uniref:Large ribosomal subunit protein uL11 n=1 Tax=Methanohalarchaeum thermophilum TaxID=1903181 RepID=A0A1Q6DT83_METT1|nr:MAG: Ribosomal protein L11 [Candidatus Methanohalarchaeum thermophilum]
MEEITALVEGGSASPGPPLGPKLGPLGVNIQEVVNEINQETKGFEGMEVPVTIKVDEETDEFEIEVGKPPTTALIKNKAGIEKGSGEPKTEFVGELSLNQIKSIADMKESDLLGKNQNQRMKEIAGTCNSMGVKVDGKKPTDFIKSLE